MSTLDPIDRLFGGMEKLGPGDNEHTLAVLDLLPKRRFGIVVDAGCGTGRQTLALARALRTTIHAVDTHEPFLRELQGRASAAGLAHLVQTHCMDMKDLARISPIIDLVWSEGSAYNMGFANALEMWSRAIPRGGFAVVSELSWLRAQRPAAVTEYFRAAYADMRSVEHNVDTATASGYDLIATLTLPRAAWVDGYYELLQPRATALLNDSDERVREFALETLKEIEIFESSEGSYGYVFYALSRTLRSRRTSQS